MISNLGRLFLAILCLEFFLPDESLAATVTRATGDCRVNLEGNIALGDYDRLVTLEAHLVRHNGESTFGSTLCLNSPGGSVFEGLKIARFVLEKGIGTRVPKDAECMSMCAIIFMMGNYRGGEVSGVSRVMHPTALLGFHRPYLSLDELASFTSKDVEEAYDLAVRTVFELLTIANAREPWGIGRMMEPDLIEVMTGTPPDNMHLISTVGEALRWNIAIEDLDGPTRLTAPHLSFACETALARPVALPEVLSGAQGFISGKVFELFPHDAWVLETATEKVRPTDTPGVFWVASQRAGYAGVGCTIAPKENHVAVCGFDGETDLFLGDCSDEYGMRSISNIALYHPSSSIAALWIMGNAPAHAATFQNCRVTTSSDQTIDDEVCLQRVTIQVQGDRSSVLHEVTWPTGAKTVIQIGARGYQAEPWVLINGQSGSFVSGPPSFTCVLNKQTGNRFCLGDG